MDDGEIQFTKDDWKAEREAAVAIFFMNAARPVPTSEIIERFYLHETGGSLDSCKKSFLREREHLAEAGFHIREAGKEPRPGGGSEKLWEADEEANFAQGIELDSLDAIGLDVACQPLLDDPSFMLAGPLRRALAKIDRTYGNAEQAIATNAPQVDALLVEIQDCIEDGLVARVTYRGVRDEQARERFFAPLGTFSNYGHRYVVGHMVREGGEGRTLNLERIEAVERTDEHYEAPADFNIEDYRKLPFQIGETQLEAEFLVPGELEDDLRRESLGKGVFERIAGEAGDGAQLTWRVDASNAEVAASWAVARGIRPVAPAAVVEAWKRCLEGVLARG